MHVNPLLYINEVFACTVEFAWFHYEDGFITLTAIQRAMARTLLVLSVLSVVFVTLLVGCDSHQIQQENTPSQVPSAVIMEDDMLTTTDHSSNTSTVPDTTIAEGPINTQPPEEDETVEDDENVYPLHEDIVATVFWVGERGNRDNDFISNVESAWDDQWMKHYGGVDDPQERNGYKPSGFEPNENPFYFALPYDDFDDDGERKESAIEVIFWVNEKEWPESESMLKNRWIMIRRNGRTAYAQWEDTGPFLYDDSGYVFGEDRPSNTIMEGSGLDVSPAVADYLAIDGSDIVSWRFVDFSDVPDGPWKEVITNSQVYWD